ncbi:ATE_N domain-containing protein/ATE_C domain-containing protein [Cephalotus follicularis]|uniref:arginyltransferase n=1 Tax=Cephalotus follicularis TaxID=3775 RepID=A0A1Q3CXV2_CEPFO|nr:ATE_N domain-containing protein/ATE_C domain-containing protein [Cephalotus follicularis]
MAGKMKKSEASSSNWRSNSDSGNINDRGESVVVDCGKRRSSCGYCRSTGRTSFSHGLWAHSITVDDYQDLLDRGWRRSGCFLYKPEMEKTCCPSYTIRLRARDFVPNKEQLRVSRRIERFLDGTLDVKQTVDHVEVPNTSKARSICALHEVSSSASKESFSCNNEETKMEEHITHFFSNEIDNAVHTCVESREFPCGFELPKASVKKVARAKRKLLVEGSEDLLYSSNIAFQIAATLRRALPALKDVHQSSMPSHSPKGNDMSPKFIAEKLASYLSQLPETKGLSIRACNGHINFYSEEKQTYMDEDAEIVTISEVSETGSGGKDCRLKKFSEHLQVKRRRLDIYLKRSSFDPEEYALYKRYQIKVHNDTPDHVTESSYRRFLVETPLIYVPPAGDGTVPPCGFGSFHQQYVIDGRLVAVGVIDILPRCLSSKYLFWDPDYAFLSLGKYSALQEIGWVKENQAHCHSLQYYYLGYYIHSCSKMRYKAAYRPSELLCPLRYQWVSFDISRPLLDRKPYMVLSDFANLQNGESSQPFLSKSLLELQHDDVGQEDRNDSFVDDEEMIEMEAESSDDELDQETSNLTSDGIHDGDIADILIELKGSRFRFRDLQRAFGPIERSYLESQLHRYQRVVGAELSERMVYSLG